MKKILSVLLICCALFPVHSVLAASADTTLPVLSRGHIQDLGDYPADGSWVASPNRIGTVGQSKRIEGFELKPDNNLPAAIELRYNVHVQNIGWLYDENDPTTWAKNGDYAGTRGDGLRIEAIKIILLDASGNKASGYHVHYQGHVQDVGDLPANSQKWVADGDQLGTVGSSLRLEALKLEIVKDASTDTDLGAYTALIKQLERLTESDHTKSSWTNLQSVLNNHVVTDKSTAAEVADAVKAIETAIHQLEKLSTTTAYDKPGTYGPTSGSETISQDVIITSTGVTLQNLIIDGDLIIDEAVGDGDVTLNNVTVTGELRVRGGGKNSIHINGGDYQNILVEKTATGAVRIVATGLDGVPFVLSENAAGEEVILEGHFDSVTVNAPDAVIKTDKQTSIKQLNIAPEAKNSTVNLGSQTTVTDLSVQAPAKVTGTGTVGKAAIASDNVSFEKAPANYTIDPGVVVPPVIPKPTPEPPTPQPPTPQPPTPEPPPGKISLSVATAPTVTLSKTYDGTTATDVTNQILDPAVITGIVANDTVTVSATATYDNKNVGSNKDITITYSLSGTNAGKYNPPAATTIKGEITQKPLTGAATTAITKEFDGTTTLNTVITEDLGQVNADTLTITRTATYQNNSGKTDAIEVGTDKPVTCSYNLSGTDAGNYSAPADHPGTGAITKRTLTVSAASLSINKNKTYDGTTDVFNGKGKIAAGNNAISVATDVKADPNINVTVTAAYDSPNAGNNRTITVSYTIDSSPANKRYQIAATETLSGASITARPLTIVAPTPVAKAYDGTADVFTEAGNTGKIYNMPITPGNIAAADAGKVTVTATATYDTGKDVGTNKKITITYTTYTLSGEAAGNYQSLPDDHSKTADITPLTITTTPIVKDSDKTKEYDGSSKAVMNDDTSKTALTIRITDINQKPIVQEAILNGTLVFDTTAVYKNNNSETSNVGNGYTIAYTYKLNGTAAHNFSLADAASDGSITGTISGGGITARKLSVTADAMGLQTEKTYDGSTSASSTITIITGGNGLTGIVGTEKVIATPSNYYASADAGDHIITTSFSLSGDNAGNYCIDPLTSSGKIKPLQLTIAEANVPAVDATKIYDGTTATNVTNQDVAVSGVVGSETVTAKATATYNDKNAGTDKSVNITYSLPAETTNYLPPADNTTKTATITARKLGYSVSQLELLKKQDGNSSVNFGNKGGLNKVPVAVETTPAYGTDTGVVHHANTVILETVSLATYSANYYESDLKNTTSATGSHPIKITGTLTGSDATGAAAGNYVLADDIRHGKILPADAVISATYVSNSGWLPDWNVSNKTLTPPDNVPGIEPFYNDTTKFYGLGSDGKIYQSENLSNWTQYTGGGVLADDNLSSAIHQLIGIDNDGVPLAVDSNGKIYAWLDSGWQDNGTAFLTGDAPQHNFTYFADTAPNSNKDYLIYQDSLGNVYKSDFNLTSPEIITTTAPAPKLLSSFSNSLLAYNGTILELYAY